MIKGQSISAYTEEPCTEIRPEKINSNLLRLFVINLIRWVVKKNKRKEKDCEFLQ